MCPHPEAAIRDELDQLEGHEQRCQRGQPTAFFRLADGALEAVRHLRPQINGVGLTRPRLPQSSDCPVEEIVKKNLRFLIGVRNEIEHQMTTRIDHQFSAKFQASAVNFNRYIKKLFGHKYSLDAEQADRALAHPNRSKARSKN